MAPPEPEDRAVPSAPREPLVDRPVWTLLAGLGLIVAYYVLPLRPDPHWVIRSALTALLVFALAGATVRELRREDDPVSRLVVLLVMVVVGSSSAAYVLATSVPGQFEGIETRTDALYFTVVTMATIGYGDIAPIGQAARILVLLSIVFNLIFVAALASALATRVRSRMVRAAQRPPHAPPPPDTP